MFAAVPSDTGWALIVSTPPLTENGFRPRDEPVVPWKLGSV